MKKINFLGGFLIVMILPLLFTTCSKSSSSGSGGNNSPVVYMQNSAYSNTNLQVSAGTLVTWTNNDNMTHTVTSNTGAFDSGDIQPGQSFRYTFSSAGTYAYHCKYHSFMTGVVVAVSGGSGGGY